MVEKNFNNLEILEAVETILNRKTKKILAKKDNDDENILPRDTETIIVQAENHIKN